MTIQIVSSNSVCHHDEGESQKKIGAQIIFLYCKNCKLKPSRTDLKRMFGSRESNESDFYFPSKKLCEGKIFNSVVGGFSFS